MPATIEISVPLPDEIAIELHTAFACLRESIREWNECRFWQRKRKRIAREWLAHAIRKASPLCEFGRIGDEQRKYLQELLDKAYELYDVG